MKSLLLSLLTLTAVMASAPAFAKNKIEINEVNFSGCLQNYDEYNDRVANLEPVVVDLNIDSRDIGVVTAGFLQTFRYNFEVDFTPVLEGIDFNCIDTAASSVGYKTVVTVLDETYMTLASDSETRFDFSPGFGFNTGEEVKLRTNTSFSLLANNLPDGELIKQFNVPIQVKVVVDELNIVLK